MTAYYSSTIGSFIQTSEDEITAALHTNLITYAVAYTGAIVPSVSLSVADGRTTEPGGYLYRASRPVSTDKSPFHQCDVVLYPPVVMEKD